MCSPALERILMLRSPVDLRWTTTILERSARNSRRWLVRELDRSWAVHEPPLRVSPWIDGGRLDARGLVGNEQG